MREIKFRGKRVEDNEWIFGYYVTHDSHRIIYEDYEGFYCEEEVIPESVGQYTGLKNKKHREIYEGDIIVNGSVPGPCFGVKGLFLQTKYKVAMVNGCFVVECDPECVDDHVFENYHLLFEMGCDGSSESIVEVIGNVYENPELLE